MAVNPDGTLLATAALSGIHLWDATAGAHMSVQALPAQSWWVTVLFHPDGKSLIYSAPGFGVMQADLRKVSGPGETPKTELSAPRQIGPATRFMALEFGPDGRSLVVGEH